MPHIHTTPGQYDFTVSAVIIRTDLSEPVVFMSKHLLSGKWVQPGGHVELDESPWEAIQREITEESGYTMAQLKLLQPKVRITKLSDDSVLQPQPICMMTYKFGNDHTHTDIIFAFTAHGEPQQSPAKGESDVTTFFNRDELLALSTDEVPANVRDAILFTLDECIGKWEETAIFPVQ